MNRITLIALSALSLLAASAFADTASTIYRGLDDQGHVVYANSPKGLRNAKKIEVAEPAISGTVAPTAAAAAPDAHPTPAPSAASGSPAPTPAAASAALAAALAAQESGKEPIEGERQGTVGGGSRLSPAYFIRQEALAAAVDDARAALNKSGSR